MKAGWALLVVMNLVAVGGYLATQFNRTQVGTEPTLERVEGGFNFAFEGEAAHLADAIGVFGTGTTSLTALPALPDRTIACLSGTPPGQVLTTDLAENLALQQDVRGRVLAQCFEPAKTERELVEWLHTLPAGTIGMIGFVGSDGDAYALSQEALAQQASDALVRQLDLLIAQQGDGVVQAGPPRELTPGEIQDGDAFKDPPIATIDNLATTIDDTTIDDRLPKAKAPLFTVGDKILAALTCMPAVNACYYDLFDVLEVRPDGWLKVVSPNGGEWMVNQALIYAFQKNPEGVIIAEVPKRLDVTPGGP